MKKILLYFLYAILLANIVCSCNDSLDIVQNYAFDLHTIPYAEKIMKSETVEIRYKLVREGNYSDTKFYIRYFQTDGNGLVYVP
jgi:hypothetical protein